MVSKLPLFSTLEEGIDPLPSYPMGNKNSPAHIASDVCLLHFEYLSTELESVGPPGPGLCQNPGGGFRMMDLNLQARRPACACTHLSATGRHRQAKSSESGVYMLYMSISGFFANATYGPKEHSDTAPRNTGAPH